jgi:hypothetical protein
MKHVIIYRMEDHREPKRDSYRIFHRGKKEMKTKKDVAG